MVITVRVQNSTVTWECREQNISQEAFSLSTLANELGTSLRRLHTPESSIRRDHTLPISNFTDAGFNLAAIAQAIGRILSRRLQARTGQVIAIVTSTDLRATGLPPISLDGEEPKLILGNRVWGLTPIVDVQSTEAVAVAIHDANERLRAYELGYRTAMSSAQAEVERRAREIESRYQSMITIPPLSQRDVIEMGVKVYVESAFLCWLLPFHYHPRYFLHTEGETLLRGVIPRELAWRMKRDDAQLKFLTQGNRITQIQLCDALPSLLDHYHRNCWGNYQQPRDSLSLPSDLYLIRDQLEKELELINDDSLARTDPLNMPSIETVRLALRDAPELPVESTPVEEEAEPERGTERGGRIVRPWTI